MSRSPTLLTAGLLLALAAVPLRADSVELRTVKSATTTLRLICAASRRDIPAEMVRGSAGVAVIPLVLRGGLLVGGRFGRGVVLEHRADGTWVGPVFVTLSGGSVGGLAGIDTTDVVLVFRTRAALERALQGCFTLDTGAAVAVGPLAGQAETDVTTEWPAGEVACYLRSRGGLFAGVSLEGAWLQPDHRGNEAFAGKRSRDETAALELLRLELTKLATPLPVAPVVVPPPPGRKRGH
jgi:lipid-binding SYLF domain-containing protein